jgi:hypothetical protein
VRELQKANRMITKADLELWRQYIKGVDPVGSAPRPYSRRPRFLEFSTRYRKAKSLDLHGLTLQEAFLTFINFVKGAYLDKIPEITIITGRSGKIRQEFPGWVDHPRIGNLIREVIAKNEGSFVIKFKKTRL